MDDMNFKNQNNTSQKTTTLNDYEIEVVKKISFWASLFYNVKNKKEQKLLPSITCSPPKTYKSISYMWNIGSLRTSLFNTFDSFKKIIIHSKKDSTINTLKREIIGKNIKPSLMQNSTSTNIIIPKNIK